VTHTARNGFLYTFERANGQTLLAKPYMEKIYWTKGIGRFNNAFTRAEFEIVVADPLTGEVKNRARATYPNFSAALTTAGGLVFTGLGDASFVACDDMSLEPLWKINVGAASMSRR
jgi:glucose dehydrogenase